MNPVVIGVIGLAFLLLIMFSGMPIAIAMGVIGFAGFSYLTSFEAGMSLVAADIYKTFSTYSYTTFPLFILMGQFIFASGIGSRVYNTFNKWIGHWPGGLAMATVGASAAFGAVEGSGIAAGTCMATIAMPEMKKNRYDLGLAGGCCALGGTLGLLIPPSLGFILFGVIAQVSIGKMFLAGVFPGLLLTFLSIGTIYILVIRNPSLGPPIASSSWKDRFKSLSGMWEIVALFTVVMGGISIGLFTPTEAGAVGAFGALLAGIARRGYTWQGLVSAFTSTLRISAMLLLLLAGASIFGRFLVVSQIPSAVATFVSELPIPTFGVWVVLALLFVGIGCFIDTMPIFLISIPIFAPVCVNLGYDLIWFGVFLTLTTDIGMITPPVGALVYAIKGVSPDVPLEDLFRGTWPFTAASILAAIILIACPQIALFLPKLVMG